MQGKETVHDSSIAEKEWLVKIPMRTSWKASWSSGVNKVAAAGDSTVKRNTV